MSLEMMQSLILILAVTVMFGWGAQRVGLPAVAGQLVSGIVLGPALLNWVQMTDVLSVLAEIGVILLMFLVGIETDFALLASKFKTAFSAAMFGAIVPLVVFYGLARWVGYEFETALFWGIVFSATSVSITAEVLSEYRQLKTPAGATILGAAVVDDLLAVGLVSAFVAYFGASGGHGHGPELAVWQQVGYPIGFFIIMLVAGKFILPHLLRWLAQVPVSGALVIGGVGIALSAAWLAQAAGLSAIVGSFLAGILIGRLPKAEQLFNLMTPVSYAVFVPVFFASIGLAMTFDGLLDKWWLLLVLSVAAVATKWLGAGFGTRLLGEKWPTANIVGIGMIARGEMALIIAKLGLDAHVISVAVYSELTLVIVVSTLVAPVLLRQVLVK
ncbi:MAG TPA: cation:proton antiporter [Lactobacillaceae bacterium]|jgi:Kef-type K+ transport system membrane component KefB